MVAEKIAIEFDYKQQRVSKHAQAVIAMASYQSNVPGIDRAYGFDPALSSSDFWQDPVTYSGWLRPNVKKPEWNTTFTGIYARMTKTDFTLTTAASWQPVTNGGSGDTWLEGNGFTADESGVTTATFLKNQPMWFGWFGTNSDVQRYIVFECGWNSTATLTSGVGLRFYSDGDVEVWKTTLVGSYKISGSNSGDTQGQQFNGVLLVPGRKRELIVIGIKGKGFSHVFADLDEADTEPTITPAGNFWFKIPYQSATRSAKIQVAKIQFPSSAYAVSYPLCFAEAPTLEQGAVDHDLYKDLYGGTLVATLKETGGSTTFVPNGTRKDCRIRVDFTGDGSRTPFLYAGRSAYDGIPGYTSDEPGDAAEFTPEATLSVGESASSVTFGMVLTPDRIIGENPDGSFELEQLEDIVPGFKEQSNRPVRVRFTGGDAGPLVIGGRSDPPEWEDSANPGTEVTRITVKDRWKGLETNIYRDVVPLDGLTFKDALMRLTAPVTAGELGRYDLDPEADTFTVPSNSSPTAGEFTSLVEAGDSSARWVDRLMDSYAPDWVYGFKPQFDRTVFFAKSVETLGTSADIEVYDNWDQALATFTADGYSDREARKLAHSRVFRTFRTRDIEPEATEVHVTGWDPRTAKPIHAYKVDSDAEDPTVPKGSRVDNWLGEKRAYGWVDTLINSESLARRCVTKLYNRLVARRRMAEWTGGLLFNPDGSLAWRGDNVKVVRNGEAFVYRITAIRCTWLKERDTSIDDKFGEWFWREATYCGELINEGRDAWRGSSNGASLNEIVSQSKLRMLSDPVRASRGSEFLLKRIPETRVLVA